MSNYKFKYKWNLSEGYPSFGIENHKLKVFGTFICGGGSTMGYKLAGFNHLGGVEIDPVVADIYKNNHKPKYLFIEDIREFNKRNELPEELYELDILDGSPPCSSFSMAGNREKDWGKEKKFKEGQKKQILDTLFFDYIKLAKKLKPKVVIAENVKGLLHGNAKAYVKNIKKEFESSGYKVQLFLLNSAYMGVPQKRERLFFICQRKDLKYKPLRLEFKEKRILTKEILDYTNTKNNLTKTELEYWNEAKQGKAVGKFETNKKYNEKSVANTIVSGGRYYHPTIPRRIITKEYQLIGSYPLDYNFKKIEPKYLIGMSVPPVMTAQIAYQIYLQWLKK